MKYISLIVNVILLTIMTASCSGQKSPNAVAKEYLLAIDNLNYEKAEKSLVRNEANLKSLENIKNFGSKMTKAQKDQYVSKQKYYNFKEENVTTNSAKIIATNNQGDFTVAIEFNLVKVNGKWLIESFRTN